MYDQGLSACVESSRHSLSAWVSSPAFVTNWMFQTSPPNSLPSVFLVHPVGVTTMPWPPQGHFGKQRISPSFLYVEGASLHQ